MLRGIYTYGFNKPSAIQQRAIVPIIKGRDVIAQAQSGTGKSSLIAITMCQLVDTSIRDVQALCLSPTRELATQTEKSAMAIGDFMSVQAHACIGGKSVGGDIQKLESGVQLVSGTPGRVFDMIQRRALKTRNIKVLILDEADEMLSKVRARPLIPHLPTSHRRSFLDDLPPSPPAVSPVFPCTDTTTTQLASSPAARR